MSGNENRAVAETRDWLKHNSPIPHELVLADLGLTTAEFEQRGLTSLSLDPAAPAIRA